jgi:hypothetical protein
MVEARACHKVDWGVWCVVERDGAREQLVVDDRQREDEVEEQ